MLSLATLLLLSFAMPQEEGSPKFVIETVSAETVTPLGGCEVLVLELQELGEPSFESLFLNGLMLAESL